MNDKQNAKKSMYQAVLQVLSENRLYYEEIPVFEKSVTELGITFNQIGDLAEQQTISTLKGTTNTKHETEIRLVNETIKTSAVLFVLAKDLKDEKLLAKTNLSKSTMYHAQGNEMLSIARRIQTEATAHAQELQDYGIKDTDILALQTIINEYDNILVAPRVVISESKQKTANLVHLFAYADTLLNDRIDKLMRIFRESAPDFYTLYFNARNVINTAARKRKTDSPEEKPEEEKEI
jgi:Glu-tRNA(Gln) amidotransferase subunit E-like FAD-binding protein